MSEIYYISDLHLGHKNVIKFDDRPFSSLEQMHNTIIENWNKRVSNEDTVYILGDFCWRKEPEWGEFIDALRGNKVLIRGNHDLKYMKPATRNKFQDVKDFKEIMDKDRHVTLCHYPTPFYKKSWHGKYYMLYWHVHNTREFPMLLGLQATIKETARNSGDALGQFYNVGCMLPYMSYTPRTLDEVISGGEEYLNSFRRNADGAVEIY